MRTIASIGQFQLDEASPIRNSKLWNQEISKITPEQLIAFLKRMAMTGHGHGATRNVEIIINEARKMIAAGEIESAPIEKFELPIRKYSIESLYRELEDFTPARQHAIMVSILTELTLVEVVTLKRADVAYKVKNAKAREIIDTLPVSISTEFVFWEYKGKRLSLLFDLPEHYELISNQDIQFYRDHLDTENSVMSENDYWLYRRAFWQSFISNF